MNQNPEEDLNPFKGKPHPIDTSCFVKTLFITYATDYINLANRSTITQEHHYNLPKEEQPETSFKKISKKIFKTETKIPFTNPPEKFSIFRSFLLTYKSKITLTLLANISRSLSKFFSIYLTNKALDEITQSITSTQKLSNKPYLLFLFTSIWLLNGYNDIIDNWVWIEFCRLSIRLQNSMICLVFEKLLTISNKKIGKTDEGSITTLIQTDCLKLLEMMYCMTNTAGTFVNLGFCILVGLYFFNTAFFVLVAGLIFLGLINKFIVSSANQAERDWEDSQSDRLSLLKDLVKNVKFVKINAIENFFSEKLKVKRKRELKFLLRNRLMWSVVDWIMIIGTAVIIIIFLFVFVKQGNDLTVGKVTVLLRLFDLLKDALWEIPDGLAVMANINVSLGRIKRFFVEEKSLEENEIFEEDGDFDVKIENLDFCWGERNEPDVNDQEIELKELEEPFIDQDENQQKIEKFFLKNINLEISKGDKVAVIGEIGSGKSTLLYSILGETTMKKTSKESRMKINKNISYVSHNPWLINSTVKDNIIMNNEYNEKKFLKILELTALIEDLRQWEDKEMHEVGEDATSLSGGQKVRVSLARALYQNSDVYLFDDIFSGLDKKVSEEIWEKVFLNFLKDKTVILVTHKLNILHHFDKICLLDSGQISRQGNFEEMKNISLYKKFEEKIHEMEEGSDLSESRSKEGKREEEKIEKKGKIKILAGGDKNTNKVLQSFKNEDKEVGKISSNTRKLFIKLSGGFLSIIALAIISFCVNAITMYSNKHLEEWAFSEVEEKQSMDYLKYYVMIWIFITFFAISRKLGEIYINYILSSKIHTKMVNALLHSKIQNFLDRVPFGRILNRFSNDLFLLDQEIVNNFSGLVDAVCNTLVLFFTISYTLGAELVFFMILYLIIMSKIEKYYMNAKREYNRLKMISHSPMINTFSDIYKGLVQIRTFNLQNFFRKKFLFYVSETAKNTLVEDVLVDWYCLVSNMVQLFVIQLPAFLSILYYYGSHHPSKLGLFFMCIFGINETLNQLLESKVKFETSLISVERCDYFTKIEPEEGYKIPRSVKKSKKILELKETNRPEIEFEKVTAVYLGMNQPALSEISFELKKGERMAIVGRTGSGKSTILKLLWKYLDCTSGLVKIKGENINEKNIIEHRERINFVLQDQFFIDSNLRENLNLKQIKECSDEEMMDILGKLEFDNQDFKKNGLDMKVGFQGGNFSKGERQLINLARCLLVKDKDIVVLDEAMGSLDLLNGEIVKGILDEFLDGKTTIAVTHNFKNLSGFDKILVLEGGRIEDYGSLSEVTQRGYFD